MPGIHSPKRRPSPEGYEAGVRVASECMARPRSARSWPTSRGRQRRKRPLPKPRRLPQGSACARAASADVAHALGAFSCLVGLRAAAATIVGCIEPGGKLLRWSVGHDARCSTTYGLESLLATCSFKYNRGGVDLSQLRLGA